MPEYLNKIILILLIWEIYVSVRWAYEHVCGDQRAASGLFLCETESQNPEITSFARLVSLLHPRIGLSSTGVYSHSWLLYGSWGSELWSLSCSQVFSALQLCFKREQRRKEIRNWDFRLTFDAGTRGCMFGLVRESSI